MILWIPLPLLWTVQLPLRRKILYGCWLCTGVFIMMATLLRCILCLQDVSQINVGTIWSIRETVRTPSSPSYLHTPHTDPPVRRNRRRQFPRPQTLLQQSQKRNSLCKALERAVK